MQRDPAAQATARLAAELLEPLQHEVKAAGLTLAAYFLEVALLQLRRDSADEQEAAESLGDPSG